MRVLIVFDWFLKLVVDGQARALRDLGHDVLLLCRDHAYEFGGDHAERSSVLDHLRSDGIGLVEMSGRRYGPETVQEMLRARSAIRRWKPDVVSAHENNDPRLLLASFGFPIVYTVHDPVPHPGAAETPIERAADWLWRRAADQLIVHGHGLVGRMPASDRRKGVCVVPHGIDVAHKASPVPPDPVVLLFGRLEAYKGVGILMEAMRHVWTKVPDVRVVVAGRGPAAGEVIADNRVQLVDRYIAEEELPGLIGEASVTVLPYLEGSQSGVGLLSIARGVPVVVTQTGALPDLAIDPSFVAPPRDPVLLADCILRALRVSQDERNQILEFARNRFSWATVASQYLRVFDSVTR